MITPCKKPGSFRKREIQLSGDTLRYLHREYPHRNLETFVKQSIWEKQYLVSFSQVRTMPDSDLEVALREADLELKRVETEFGPDDSRLADCLEAYGYLLKEKKIRLLDAANMLARASIIREKSTKVQVEIEEDKKQQNLMTNHTSTEGGETKSVSANTKDCPFCGESIKIVAVKCRYCGSALSTDRTAPETVTKVSSSPANIGTINKHPATTALSGVIKHRKMIVSVAIAIFALIAVRILNNEFTRSATSRIHGAAWLTKGNGQSNLLRGLEVSTCDLSVADVMERERIKTWKKLYEISSSHDLVNSIDYGTPLINAIESEVTPHIISTVHADVDGKYEISNAHSGYLYARFVDAYSGAIWLVPVIVKPGEDVTLDLDNHNAEVLVQRGKN